MDNTFVVEEELITAFSLWRSKITSNCFDL